jgi:predicted kinase
MSNDRTRLVIVCGLPGAGKTTHAMTLEFGLNAVRMAPDEWMETLGTDLYDEQTRAKIEDLQWQLAQRLLALGVPVIIEWGTWSRSERDTLRVRARELGPDVELHYLSAPTQALFERVQRRGRETPAITRAMFDEWARHFEAPTDDERALFDAATTIVSGRPSHTAG